MSYANAPQPEPHGSFSQENAPQVVVRAGKTFVCSACGTLVEVPADVVGQLVIAVGPSPQDTTGGESFAREEEPIPKNPAHRKPQPQPVLTREPRSSSQEPLPDRPKSLKRPQADAFTSQIIDGLRVPSANQLDRALAWVTFHLKVLDRQGSELKRLQKLLKQQPAPRPRPHQHAKWEGVHQQGDCASHTLPAHAHEDVSMRPAQRPNGSNPAKERGPP
ncbi:hypothetical protein [Bremerella volcania]|uniref:hypothetical protein n=1 Tax=Bremerella volcania TaxID=2527984 RepID=UPI00119FDF3A|nr:hypothetical protein [Bremerella volcania]